MREFKDENEAHLACSKDGMLLPRAEINTDKISTMLELSQSDIEAANMLLKANQGGNFHWNTIYKLYYDALHSLVEAFLIFDKIKSRNHQCLFAYLCVKHSELDFSWNFFEKARTKRNGISYYGQPVNKKDWKEIEVQMKLYINTLKKEIEKKLKN